MSATRALLGSLSAVMCILTGLALATDKAVVLVTDRIWVAHRSEDPALFWMVVAAWVFAAATALWMAITTKL